MANTKKKPPKGMFLFVQDGCPHCVDEKKAVNKGPLRDKVKILDLSNDAVIDNPAVRNLIETLDITGVPQMIAVDGNKVCMMERDEKGVLRRGKCTTVGKKLF